MIRLDKYLADMGIGSRLEVKKIIKKGEVLVNGKIQKKSEAKICTNTDVVCCQGKNVQYEEFVYYMLHKPGGCVSAVKDNVYPTVLSYIDNSQKYKLFPVGRLDVDTEGLLLITNDGQLAHELLSPKKHIPKTYYAKVNGIVTATEKQLFLEGLDIGDGKKTLPSELEIIKSDTESEIRLSITEGRYHQVKRMFEAVGMKVVYLKRISMGSLTLDENLDNGNYRPLTEEEIKILKER